MVRTRYFRAAFHHLSRSSQVVITFRAGTGNKDSTPCLPLLFLSPSSGTRLTVLLCIFGIRKIRPFLRRSALQCITLDEARYDHSQSPQIAYPGTPASCHRDLRSHGRLCLLKRLNDLAWKRNVSPNSLPLHARSQIDRTPFGSSPPSNSRDKRARICTHQIFSSLATLLL